MEKSTRLDRLDRLVDDFSINSTWPIFDRLDRLHRSTTGSNVDTGQAELPKYTCMPNFILIHPTVWPQCTNVTERQDRQTTEVVNAPSLNSFKNRLDRFWFNHTVV